MTDISNKTLGFVLGIALFVSVFSLFSLPNFNIITGRGITGQARINITELAALNVTRNFIDFGNGSVTQGLTNCTLATNRVGDYLNCFTGNKGPNHGGFKIANVGNVAMNVTVKATKNGSLTTIGPSFWNVAGGKYLYRCIGNGTSAISVYTNIENKTKLCQGNVSADVGSHGFTVDLNITIPKTATGLKNDTFTFVASKT